MSIDSKAFVEFCRRNVLLSACVGSSLVLLGFLYLRLDEPDRLQTALDERAGHLRKLKANITNSNQLDNHVRDLAAVNQDIAQNALRVGDLAQNLKVFYELEAKTGVKLIDVRPSTLAPPGKDAGPGSYATIDFAVTIQGEYEQLLEFVRQLEGGRQFCRLSQANISASEDSSQRLSFNLQILGVRT